MTRRVPALALWVVLLASAAARTAQVTVDTTVTHQTIMGWGADIGAPAYYDNGTLIPPEARDQLIDIAVNELGLTRLRHGPPAGNFSNDRAWEAENDDWDPLSTIWNAFNTASADAVVTYWILPFKQAVEAAGDKFDLWISPSFFDGGSTGSVPGWMLYNRGEYAEYALSFLQYLKNTHGLEADYYVICNEAGNGNAFSPGVVAGMVKTLGPMLPGAGLATLIQFPESVNPAVAWNNYITSVQGDSEFWQFVGCVTYHLYGTRDPYRSYIRDDAHNRGLPTGQTEYMSKSFDNLYNDLTLGGVSFWNIYGLAGPWSENIRINLDNTSFVRGPNHWKFRQVFRYVRRGAVRVEASSDDTNVRALAFVDAGEVTVVLANASGSRTVSVSGLPAGTYGVCHTVGSGPYVEDGLQAVTAGQPLSLTVPSDAVVTIYPHPGGNLPPTVTDWKASPSHLTLPADTLTLSASATDPELDTLSYSWTVASQPAGASVQLSSPNSASTTASGLSVAGLYRFDLTVGDGSHTVAKYVLVRVYSGNQPPILVDVHNRNPVWITLPTTGTELRGSGLDVDGDTLSYQWSVVSSPAGASPVLAAPTDTRCAVSGLTVAGDYVFRFTASDGTNSVSTDLTVRVHPENPNAPVITNAQASPALITLPTSSTTLSAVTSDADGDPLSHWWSVKNKPAGANPVFSDQGAATTTVSGLTVAGDYVFTLVVVDRTRYDQADVTVTVQAESQPPAVQVHNMVLAGTVDDTLTTPPTVLVNGQSRPAPGGSWTSGDLDASAAASIEATDASDNKRTVRVAATVQ